MDGLVIGMGEIGTAIQAVFRCDYIGRNQIAPKLSYDVLHICIPFTKDFAKIVQEYQFEYNPKYTIIHSTVKVGTCTSLNAISSPVLGIHPHLEKGIRTFTKFLGGEKADEAADYFRRAGLKVYVFDKAETCELMKILDTTFYGVCIEYTKDVKRLTKEFNVPFEAWTLWTDNYNKGYIKLGHLEYTRPNLVPIMTPIKGHCVMPNTDLLETKFTKLLKDLNE